jgi:anti-sigma B factor antagonist
MQISLSEQGPVTVATLDGDALGGPDGSALHDALHSCPGGLPAHVVVDLSAVRHMNSSGLGMLIGSLTSVRQAGGDLRLAGASARIQTLLQVTRLLDLFQTFETADEAVASFAG